MADHSAIEWTNATWNPLVGCSRVSAGCQHCYAERQAYRFARQRGSVYEGTARLVNGKPTFTGRVNFNPRVLDQPLRWRAPRKIFVNSMSDLFHEKVPDAAIDQIFAVMALASQHTFQVLTKRPERMRDYCASDATLGRVAREVARCIDGVRGADVRLEHEADGLQGLWLPNVWLGVSVEDQAAADARIPLLLQTPAAVRFLSCEPLLGPIDLTIDGLSCWPCAHCAEGELVEWDTGANACRRCDGTGKSDEVGLDWVIAGGESGPCARPMHPDWARSLRDQCAAAGVPFFFKQWGEWIPFDYFDAATKTRLISFKSDKRETLLGEPGKPRTFQNMKRVGKKKAGHELDGAEHHAFPQVTHG